MVPLLFLFSLYPLLCSSCSLPPGSIPPYQVFQYTQYVDHFNYYASSQTFQQRYLLWNDCWMSKEHPIFFYAGNEGPITDFWNNTGFLFELALRYGALVVFAEHRYYGESIPLGANSWTPPNIGYLSSEQALADYAVMLSDLKVSVFSAPSAPVIAFGGSYGGMLAAWMRMKYPNVIDGALAASAPIFTFARLPHEPTYFDTTTADFALANPTCPDLVRNAFKLLLAMSTTKQGLKDISDKMRLCSTLLSDQVEHLILWVTNSFGTLAMLDYPYPTDFLGKLPGWPVNVACQYLINGTTDPITALGRAAGFFYNGTSGSLPCYDIFSEFVFCADQTGCGTGTDGMSWDYQACTEMIYFPETNFVTDMFPARNWNIANLTEYCKTHWGVVPRETWVSTLYGGEKLRDVTNIIFSNGILDPWHGGGVLHNISDSLVSILIDKSAHHLDLRASNPLDPASVVAARMSEAMYLERWMNDARKNKYQKTGNLQIRDVTFPWAMHLS